MFQWYTRPSECSFSASRPSQKKSFIERLYIRLNWRQGLALYNEMAKKEIIKPSFGLSTFLALSSIGHGVYICDRFLSSGSVYLD